MSKVNGIILAAKPTGISSNIFLQKLKRLFKAQKAGHTGTLDPLASGLLPICFGEATKFASYALEGDKTYTATIQLGITTTTYDKEGGVVKTTPVAISNDQIIQCLNNFLGNIQQTPPIYSALKINGKKLYEYARNNETIIIPSREITIYSIKLLRGISSDNTFKINVKCSKGTYIRTLAHDIGEKLGVGAILYDLERTETNNLTINNAHSIDKLQSLTQNELLECLLPIDLLIEHLPLININDFEYSKIRHGNSIANLHDMALNLKLRLYYNNQFIGLAITHNDLIKPIRLINSDIF